MIQPGTRFIHLPDLDMVTGRNTIHSFPRHVHESYCFGLVERGARIITSQDATVHISPGEVFVLNPGQPHTCQSVGADNQYYVISMKPDVMQAADTSTKPLPRPHFESIQLVDEQVVCLMRKLCALIERDHDPIERESVLIELLARLIGCYSSSPPDTYRTESPRPMIQRAQDYIHAHYTDKLTLAELAHLCHLSPYHFQRVFLEQTGLSPHDYLLYVRIKHGKGLLRQGMPIAAVAQDVGFVDQSHFTHSFNRIVGITPGHFAQQYTSGRRHAPPLHG